MNRAPTWLAAGLLVLAAATTAGVWYYFSPEFTDVGYRPVQPVEFSHALHAGELSMDCRYCHATVEVSAVASVPPTKVCMNCHQVIGRELDTLAAVRTSAQKGRPIQWVRVHKVPEYAYFDHGVHVRAGVGCASCHGPIHTMERVMQMEPLSMGWCLDCHRDPAPHLRPPERVTDMEWEPPEDQAELAAAAMEERRLAPPQDCSGCHR